MSNIESSNLLQSLSILFYLYVTIGAFINYLLMGYVIIFTKYYWIVLLYIAYCLGEGDISERYGRSSDWVRRWRCWKYCCDYFPIRLVKTAELDVKKNYILCTFPHGLFAMGVILSFITEGNNVSQLFPGIRFRGFSLSLLFKFPFTRHVALASGVRSAAKESINTVLSHPGKGTAFVLSVGGSAESLRSKPNTNEVVLKNRRGFIKMALRHGVSLLPVFSFGETDILEQRVFPEDSWQRRAQDKFRGIFKIAPVILIGSGFLRIMPKRRPIFVVVGKPLDVEQVVEPTNEQINDLHKKFVDSLTALFEAEKHKYLENADNASLVIT